MNTVRVLTVILVCTAVAVPLASARGGYRVVATDLFRLDKKDGQPTITCQFCHQNPNGGAPWNKWGETVREQFFGAANKDIAQALYLALKARKDSDGDGYDDVLEVLAKTRPGDPNSKPSSPKDTLEAELKAWGGVDSYKPKPK